ncbi:hypothetical protein [Dechloromonas sp. H13]|uniref:hypothetical protein n=1 Tax=Dechloromonas sp. H13 TaxID=2570193 RepID=UPI001D187924|nr:hypothetical protein [Dechloromonas sp. H13]
MKLEGGTKTATEITEVLAEVAIASPYFPPALVFAPLAIIAGMATTPAVEAAREQYLKPCRDIWSADGGDVAGRLKAIFWKDSIPALLDKKLRKHFAAKGLEARLLPIIIDKHLQFSEKPKAPWSHDAFEEVHQGLGKSVIIGGELEMTLTWGKPEDQCGVKLEFNLPLNAITFEPEYRYLAESEVTVTRSLLGEEAIKRLANDPEIAAALIHGAVEELADGIAWRYFP